MATTRHLRRVSETIRTQLRSLSAAAAQNHEFIETPSKHIASWQPPSTPKEAESRLALLRREYDKKVKMVRKGYINEMDMLRADKARKDEATREFVRVLNEERKSVKERQKAERFKLRLVADRLFRHTLLKERAEKLAYWKKRVEQVEEKKKKAKEGVCNRSSMWVDEADLESKLLVAIVDHDHFGFTKETHLE